MLSRGKHVSNAKRGKTFNQYQGRETMETTQRAENHTASARRKVEKQGTGAKSEKLRARSVNYELL